MDPATIAEALKALGGALSAVNGTQSIIQKWKGAKPPEEDVRTVQAALADLLQKITEATATVATLTAENVELREEVRRMKAGHDLMAARAVKDGLYVFKEPFPPGYDAGPYCPGCFDKTGKPIRLRPADQMEQQMNGATLACTACKQTYGHKPADWSGFGGMV